MIKSFILILYLFILINSPIYADASVKKTHFTIAIDPEYIPFTQKDIEGKPAGLLVDFWNLWAKKNGYTITYKFYPWEETLLATQKGEVDFHSGTTKDREWMVASNPIYSLKTAIFTLHDSPLNIARDFQHKHLGTIDSYYADLVKKVTGNTVKITLFEDYKPMVEALKKNEIDGLIDDVEAVKYYFIKTGQLNRFKMVKDKLLQFDNNIYAISNEKNSGVLKQINKGLKNISLAKLVEIEKIWLPTIDHAYYNKQLKSHVSYTHEELTWLQNHNPITLMGDSQWEIYPVLENNMYLFKGVIGDYIKEIEKKLNTNFKIILTKKWEEITSLSLAKSPDIIIGSINEKTKNILGKVYNFLSPFETGSLVVIMDRKIRFITSLYDIKDKKIGLLGNQEYTQRLESVYKGYSFSEVITIKKLLNKLKSKELDAIVVPLATAVNYLAKDEYGKLDIVGKMDEKEYVSIGIRKDKPILESIINKTLLCLGDSYKEKILASWTDKLNYIEKIDYNLVYAVAMLLGLLLISTGYYAYSLKRKHQYANELTQKMKVLALTDDMTKLPNRRAFNQKCKSLDYSKDRVGLLFVDIDYFKNYNDEYGHLQGDETLKRIGEIIDIFSSEDVYSYRVGGEEFGFILYQYSLEEAVKYAEKIRQFIFNEKIEHEGSPLKYITVSIGVCISEPGKEKHNLYQCADKVLYLAKKLGRNKVCYEGCKVD